MADGNGRQVTRPPPQSELPKRNAICVFTTTNGNGRQATRPPPQSELRKRNALCVNNGIAGSHSTQSICPNPPTNHKPLNISTGSPPIATDKLLEESMAVIVTRAFSGALSATIKDMHKCTWCGRNFGRAMRCSWVWIALKSCWCMLIDSNMSTELPTWQCEPQVFCPSHAWQKSLNICRITAPPCRKDNEMDATDYRQG